MKGRLIEVDYALSYGDCFGIKFLRYLVGFFHGELSGIFSRSLRAVTRQFYLRSCKEIYEFR